jgi:hypothetical protein
MSINANQKGSSLEIKSHKKNNVSKKILLIIFSLFAAYVMSGCGFFKKEPKETPSPTPTETVTPTPTPDYSIGDRLVKELTDKKYVDIFDSKSLIFYNKVAKNVLTLINGGRPENIDEDLYGDNREIIIEEGKVETKSDRIDNYKKVIEKYCEESINPNTNGPINIGEYQDEFEVRLSEEEINLLNEISNDARNIAMSASKLEKVNDEHLKLIYDFMIKEMYVLNGNNTYKNANLWFQLLIMTQLKQTNEKLIPSYIFVPKTSEPEIREAEFIQSFFMDMENIERYFPYATEEGLRYVGEYSKKSYTYEEMVAFTNPDSPTFNPNMKEKGIAFEIGEEQIRVLSQIYFAEKLIFVEPASKTK